MNDKELLSQLNKMKSIKPDSNWKEKNREILLSQIYGLEVSDHKIEFNLPGAIGRMFSSYILRSITQPVMAVILIVAFLLGGGMLSLSASRDAKPGDSLYIAKIINEKTQIALTFDEKKKVQLGLEFAKNRAEELDRILADVNNENKNEKVEKLVSNFKKEISGVKSRLEKIAKDEGIEPSNEEDAKVFSANVEKEDKGIQISIQDQDINSEDNNEVAPNALEVASSTPDSESEGPKTEPGDPQRILAEAKNLLDQEDYSGTIDRLEEVDKVISQISPENNQEESSESENATSTEEDLGQEDGSGEVLGIEETVEEIAATSTEENN